MANSFTPLTTTTCTCSEKPRSIFKNICKTVTTRTSMNKYIGNRKVEELICKDTLSGGPFHFSVRAGTYGEVYDEIPWRVRYKLSDEKSRGLNDNSCSTNCSAGGGINGGQTYSPNVLNDHWTERRRNKRTPISQYNRMYRSEYADSYGRGRCCSSSPLDCGCGNEESERVLFREGFKVEGILGAYPGHQPDLNLLRYEERMRQCCEAKQNQNEDISNIYCSFPFDEKQPIEK